jgi:23S rRNA (uridine2552-2'-O)-methyltransferase
MDAIDAPRAIYLAELALALGVHLLKRDGVALIKLLQGAGFQEFVAAARRDFRQVRLLRPEASRSRSAETYLLASGRRMV